MTYTCVEFRGVLGQVKSVVVIQRDSAIRYDHHFNVIDELWCINNNNNIHILLTIIHLFNILLFNF